MEEKKNYRILLKAWIDMPQHYLYYPSVEEWTTADLVNYLYSLLNFVWHVCVHAGKGHIRLPLADNKPKTLWEGKYGH